MEHINEGLDTIQAVLGPKNETVGPRTTLSTKNQLQTLQIRLLALKKMTLKSRNVHLDILSGILDMYNPGL